MSKWSVWCLHLQLLNKSRKGTFLSCPGVQVLFYTSTSRRRRSGPEHPPIGVHSRKPGWSWFPGIFVWPGLLHSGQKKGEGQSHQPGVSAPLSFLAAETKEQFYANQRTGNEHFLQILLLSLGNPINERSLYGCILQQRRTAGGASVRNACRWWGTWRNPPGLADSSVGSSTWGSMHLWAGPQRPWLSLWKWNYYAHLYGESDPYWG